ncbi:MAG: Unknown protein [uncultured Sulfurovum sp.]|uniref:Uncharacterized protein n=1 Tax=uncultured Sulfurovum sp. TaxID=269237 RepID=A0A6S6SZT3_9BACT|nr:MAG: Unknown protein [uncultured Sulfurovum sp.]
MIANHILIYIIIYQGIMINYDTTQGLMVKKLILIAFLAATTLTTASAEGMFSMGDMMKEMTDAAKKIKTEISDATTGLKDSVTDIKNKISPEEETPTATVPEKKSNANKPKDAPVSESKDLSKK